jgi:23S rRNA (uracil1939-C5)-methyltransferase
MSRQTLTIDAMGARGEGVAHDGAGDVVYVPYALPGESVEADVARGRGRLERVVQASPERVDAPCRHFGRCGGCMLQHWASEPYRAWKRQLVTEALARRGLEGVEVGPLVDAHGVGRRRVSLTVERGKAGFKAHRSHQLVAIDQCPVLDPALARAAEIAQALARAVGAGKGLRVYLMATHSGIDCELPDVDDPALEARVRVADVAEAFDLARVTAAGDLLIERRKPVLDVDGASVTPPPGGFAQATGTGEAALAGLVVPALEGHAIVADLFCGWGTFALRLARQSKVLAIDSDAAAVAALAAGLRTTQGLKPVVSRVRDLMRDPITAAELKGVTGVVFDPPRAGAAAQAEELVAADGVSTVVGVSCDAGTFARDAAILTSGGFRLQRVVPVDQFLYTAHVEMVGVFAR